MFILITYQKVIDPCGYMFVVCVNSLVLHLEIFVFM